MAKGNKPPMRASEESTQTQLELARRQGAALHETVRAMDEESGVIIQRAGDYEIALAVEEAEGMWHLRDDELVWENPQHENCHVEVCVRDRADGRFLPGLEITATVLDSGGNEVGTHRQPFLWHPWLYHYGRNWRVPSGGAYQVRVRIETPTFMRHDHENGRRYAEPVEVEFDGVEITPGQKRVG